MVLIDNMVIIDAMENKWIPPFLDVCGSAAPRADPHLMHSVGRREGSSPRPHMPYSREQTGDPCPRLRGNIGRSELMFEPSQVL